jgi:hypothetical protein
MSHVVVGLCAAALTVPVWTLPAAAATGTGQEAAAYGAYFNSAGIRKPDQSPIAPPNVTNNADGVAPGKLAVAARANMDDKISFLYFQLADLPPGATITKAVLTVPTVPPDEHNVSFSAEPAKVRACPAGPEGFFGEDGASIQDAPSVKCDKAKAVAKPSPDGKAYVFDIASIAETWATSNDGVALVPNEGAKTTPFQIVFDSADKATLVYEYTAPDQSPTGSTGSTAGTGSTDTGTIGSTSTGAGTTSSDAGTLPAGTATADVGGAGTADTSALSALPAAPAPAVANPAPQVANDRPLGTRRTARNAALEVLRPPPAFWAAALLLAGGLVLLGLILGDRRAPALSASATPSRLSRALADRQRSARLVARRTA